MAVYNHMAKFKPSISPEFLQYRIPQFAAYVFIVSSLRMPTSIAMAAATGGSTKMIVLPTGTTADDLPMVQERVREHYRLSQGNVALWGRTTGYLFVFSPTDAILLDTDGNEVGPKNGRFWPQSVSIQDGL